MLFYAIVVRCFAIFLLLVILTPGFDNANGEWDEYPSYVNSDGLEIGSPVRIWHLFLIYLQPLFVMLIIICIYLF